MADMEGSRPFLLGGRSTWRLWLLIDERLKAERPLEARTARSEAGREEKEKKRSARSVDLLRLSLPLSFQARYRRNTEPTFIHESPDVDDTPEHSRIDRRRGGSLVSFLSGSTCEELGGDSMDVSSWNGRERDGIQVEGEERLEELQEIHGEK